MPAALFWHLPEQGGQAFGAPVGSEWAGDLVVLGGGVGGVAAALAAARAGLRVIVTEPTDWIGGQLTSQAVPPDEHPWIEQFGATASYRAFRQGVRDYYRRHYPLTARARATVDLDPGNGGVSRLCHEPHVALAVLYELLAPHLAAGRVTLLLNTELVAASVDGDRVRAVTVRYRPTDRRIDLVAPYFIDATEEGDLLPLAKIEYVTGSESQQQTGELHAPSEARPDNMQAITWCFPMEYVAEGEFVEDAPEDYAFWRDYVPALTPPWSGKLLDLTATHPITLKRRSLAFDPQQESEGWWTYRRIIDRANFESGAFAGSVTLVNWPQNDYWLGGIIDVSAEQRARHLRGAQQLSRAWFYWLQTEAPRPDGGQGWPGLRMRPELVGTQDGLAKAPYIRESRRIRAEFTVTEEHVGAEARSARTGTPMADVRAEEFHDSVGVGSYRIDLHPTTGGDNYLDVSSLPFQIPLGALIPERMENVLAGGKNLGVTHITNGCYRLHPVEWNVGEAAAWTVAFAREQHVSPRAIRNDEKRLAAFQRRLKEQGVETDWPRLRNR